MTLCFGGHDFTNATGPTVTDIRNIRCFFRKKVASLKAGTVVTRTFTLRAPTVDKTGTYMAIDNYTHFNAGDSSSFWSARGFACVTAPGDPTTFKICTGGTCRICGG